MFLFPALRRAVILSVLGLLAAGLAGTREASAQEEERPRVRPTGIRFDLGLVSPENGKDDLVIGGTVNLGTILRNWMHLSAGFSSWSSELDTTDLGLSRQAELSNFSVVGDVRVNLFRWGVLRPYVLTGVGLHFVSASVPADPVLEDALSSTNAGWEAGLGVAVGRRLRATGEVRRQFVSDVGNWSFRAGVGFMWGNVPPADDEGGEMMPPVEPGEEEVPPPGGDLPGAVREMNLFYPQTARVQEIEGGVLLTVAGSALFDYRDEFLRPEAVGDLSRLGALVRERSISTVMVAVHTDDSGNSEANLSLSRGQAESVKQALAAAGVPESRIRAVGYGHTQPVAGNETPDGQARNRRVEIRLIGGS